MDLEEAAVKIQSAYRGYRCRSIIALVRMEYQRLEMELNEPLKTSNNADHIRFLDLQKNMLITRAISIYDAYMNRISQLN
ncbi:hypothetical protein BC833DRAFT_590936 [Globomyces pollinis-pini]|nr:hypothetical protein BC833DRAFT_590936 [Globomyces pollinis-pini]